MATIRPQEYARVAETARRRVGARLAGRSRGLAEKQGMAVSRTKRELTGEGVAVQARGRPGGTGTKNKKGKVTEMKPAGRGFTITPSVRSATSHRTRCARSCRGRRSPGRQRRADAGEGPARARQRRRRRGYCRAAD